MKTDHFLITVQGQCFNQLFNVSLVFNSICFLVFDYEKNACIASKFYCMVKKKKDWIYLFNSWATAFYNLKHMWAVTICRHQIVSQGNNLCSAKSKRCVLSLITIFCQWFHTFKNKWAFGHADELFGVATSFPSLQHTKEKCTGNKRDDRETMCVLFTCCAPFWCFLM